MKRLFALCLMALTVLALVAVAGAGTAKYPEMRGDWFGEWHVIGPDNGKYGGGQMDMVLYTNHGSALLYGTVSVVTGSTGEPFLYLTSAFYTQKEFKGVGTSCVDNQVSAFITGTVAGSMGASSRPTITGVWQGMDGRTGWFSLKRKPF